LSGSRCIHADHFDVNALLSGIPDRTKLEVEKELSEPPYSVEGTESRTDLVRLRTHETFQATPTCLVNLHGSSSLEVCNDILNRPVVLYIARHSTSPPRTVWV
jgi:hypothetical protein